jgi:acyl dehydratase
MDISPTPPCVRLHFTATPSNWRALGTSLLAGRPPQADVRHLDARFHALWQGAQADAVALARYCTVCELPANGTLPLLYLHAMAMPLHMAILSHARFPLRLLGLVHWSNTLESLRPVAADETLEMECTLDGISATDRGQSFSLHTTVRAQGVVVWREVSTFLSPLARSKSGKKNPASEAVEPTWGAATSQWPVAANAGRRFAGPSGDWNPIHMCALTARLFGYPRAIGHGMFSAARCLALLQKDRPADEAVRLELRFKRPLLIPGTVALHTALEGDATRFVLRVQPTGEPHIEGRLEALVPVE